MDFFHYTFVKPKVLKTIHKLYLSSAPLDRIQFWVDFNYKLNFSIEDIDDIISFNLETEIFNKQYKHEKTSGTLT